MADSYTLVNTALGWVGFAGGEEGLRAVTLPQPSPTVALERLKEQCPNLGIEGADFGDLPQRMQDYCQGKEVAFPDRLDLSPISPFLRSVYAQARLIPWGERRSYGSLATAAGRPKAARAVGQAMARNPWAIIVP
jgi:methylated-DNA-[protein]-cysteine S-methyltransferase